MLWLTAAATGWFIVWAVLRGFPAWDGATVRGQQFAAWTWMMHFAVWCLAAGKAVEPQPVPGQHAHVSPHGRECEGRRSHQPTRRADELEPLASAVTDSNDIAGNKPPLRAAASRLAGLPLLRPNG
jgi:hypothetical protein